MDKIKAAYCAGVIDSDGCITIAKRRTPKGWTYPPKIFVRQVERGAVDLLLSLFGGNLRMHPPSTPGGRDLWQWEVTHRRAIRVAGIILPFLRIKHEQAKILLEFGKHMANHRMRTRVYWFKPVAGEPMYTPQEAADAKGVDRANVYQAVSNGSVPSVKKGRSRLIPKRFWDSYTMARGQHPLPPEYVALREELVAHIRSFNGPTRGVSTASRVR